MKGYNIWPRHETARQVADRMGISLEELASRSIAVATPKGVALSRLYKADEWMHERGYTDRSDWLAWHKGGLGIAKFLAEENTFEEFKAEITAIEAEYFRAN